VSSATLSYRDKPQAEVHAAVCDLTVQIVPLLRSKGYVNQARLQKLRRQRSELQALLTRPTLVWVNPSTARSRQ
jgi:hypothetical protein